MTQISITNGLSSHINANNNNSFGTKTNGKYNDPAKWAASTHLINEKNRLRGGIKLSTTIR